MDQRAIVLCLAASIGLASCAVSDPTRYYTLGLTPARRAESAPSASPWNTAREAGTVSIGVGPVSMPGYLNRSQILTRTGRDQLELGMFHRWAEPLEDGIVRILAEEIGARVPTERIATFPWRGEVARILDYRVVVGVVRFDGRTGGDVTLDTRWRILGRDGGELAFGRSTVSEAVAGTGYEPMVAAMTRAVMTFGHEIAAEIRAMPLVK
jgi:uncharacterized lipoprotein YmbA